MAFWVGDAGKRLDSPTVCLDDGRDLRYHQTDRVYDGSLPYSYCGDSLVHQDAHHHRPTGHGPPIMTRNGNQQSFIIIREGSPAPTHPHLMSQLGRSLSAPMSGGASTAMERTESGLSVSSDNARRVFDPPRDLVDLDHDECDCKGQEVVTTGLAAADAADPNLISDMAAARLVRDHVASLRRRSTFSRHGRILRSLIRPKTRDADFALDNDALHSIFSAANELFFANRLTRRVRWDWSHPASAQYRSSITGTTALRRRSKSPRDGYETLIVLSSPMLRDTRYNRRLLIATFLHEVIHCYLFIMCGLKARSGGGHTEGFRQIAHIIDRWVGRECLRLVDIDADLDFFRAEDLDYSGRSTPASTPSPRPPKGMRTPTNSHGSDDYNAFEYAPDKRPESRFLQPLDRSTTAPIYVQPRRHHALGQDNGDGWQWQEREGFLARVPLDAGELSHDVQAAAAPYICLTPQMAPRQEQVFSARPVYY